MLDNIKATGYHYSSIGAVTVAASDMIVPQKKYELLKEADETVDKIEKCIEEVLYLKMKDMKEL